jgi:hypothetical protein
MSSPPAPLRQIGKRRPRCERRYRGTTAQEALVWQGKQETAVEEHNRQDEQRRETRWFAGIDWADKHHDGVVLDAMGQRLSTRRYPHSAEGLASLTANLRALGSSPEEVVCVVEMRQGRLIAALLRGGAVGRPCQPQDGRPHASGLGSQIGSARRAAAGAGWTQYLARSATAAAGLPAASGPQGAHARPGQSHPAADAARQPIDGLPQRLLSRGARALRQADAPGRPCLSHGLPDARGGARRQ